MQKLDDFLTDIKKCAEDFLKAKPRRVVVLHHNDSDGISSGAILLKAFERQRIPFSSYCLEKPYPQVLEKIFAAAEAGTVVVFADFASGMLPLISDLNTTNLPVIVLDHHKIERSDNPKLKLLNCLDYGISGNKECSASNICFLFAQALNAYNQDLARLAMIGAIGDGMLDAEGKLQGVNAHVAAIALGDKRADFDGEYYINFQKKMPVKELCRYVDALGSFAYFDSGPDIAIKGIQSDFSESFIFMAKGYLDKFEKNYNDFFSQLTLNKTKNIEWFDTKNFFDGYGVKTVGLVCQKLIAQKKVNQKNYLAGFQKIPNKIPGLGNVAINETKLSMRVPPELNMQVKDGKALPLTEFLPPATIECGGFSDACHPHSGAATIKIGREETLIEAMQRLLDLKFH